MRNLFDGETAAALKVRIGEVRPDSDRQWGRMTPAQAIAHCAALFDVAVGNTIPTRMFIGRLIGGMVRGKVLGDDKPLARNSPTDRALMKNDADDLDAEKRRLLGLIDRFAGGGAAGCTPHPHSFFGRLAPEQWAILTYKHTDHHLRQFGV